MCFVVGTQDPAVRSIQDRGALVWSLLQPQLLSCTHSIAGTWEPHPPGLLVGLVEIKSSSERPVAAGSSQLLKPGLHPAVSASAQLGLAPWCSLPRWPNPSKLNLGLGRARGSSVGEQAQRNLAVMSPGLNPAQLLCKPVRLKLRRDEAKGGDFLCAPPPCWLPRDGRRRPRAQGGIGPWPAWMFCRVSANVSAGQCSRCVV